MKRVVLGVTGSIAAYKSAELVRLLTKAGIEVTVVMTRSGAEFITPLTLATLSSRPVTVELFGTPVGPTAGWETGDKPVGSDDSRPASSASSIEHIRATREADLIVVAPATANLLGKIAHGIADDALSTTILASTVPVLYCPAMNTRMWEHPAVRANVRLLLERGAFFVDPGTGELACGEFGAGRMSEPSEILGVVMKLLAKGSGRGRLLVTAGGTVEAIDPVRCVTNHSSGKMGFAIAEAGRDLGYEVTLIRAATTIDPPAGVEVVSVQSALEMGSALEHLQGDHDLLVMAAAVSDYRPRRSHAVKMASGESSVRIDLVPNPDLLGGLRGLREDKVTVGFALEWGGEAKERTARAKRKLKEKGLDLIALNDPSRPESAFGGDSTHLSLFFADGKSLDLGLRSKYEAARALLEQAAALKPAKARNENRAPRSKAPGAKRKTR